MKRFISVAMSVIIFAVTLSFSSYNTLENISADTTTSWPKGPSTVAESAILLEPSTGTVLYDKKCHKKMYPASITKIMTALLTIENCKLDETVTFTDTSSVNSLEPGAASISAVAGEKMTVKDCLYALMLHSANEVATALGEHISGDAKSFAKLMTQRAKQAGATGTNFANANGLFNKNHYVTAYDMAMIMKDALKYPVFREIINTSSYTLPKDNKRKALPIVQRHKMVRPNSGFYYEGIIGGKTGFTNESGTTLVTSAERNGMTLIVVVLNSHSINSYNDTKALLDYGFDNFKLTNVSENDNRFSTGDTFYSNFTSVFQTEKKHLYIDDSSSIVLPKTAKFSDTTSELSFIANDKQADGKVATISYKYGDKSVGTSTVLFGATKKVATSLESKSEVLTTSATQTTTSSQSATSKSAVNSTDKKIVTTSSSDNKKEVTNSSENSDKVNNDKKKSSGMKIFIILFAIIVIASITTMLVTYHNKLNKVRASKRKRNY